MALNTSTARLNALVNGLACGVICGVGLLVITLWLVIKGGDVVGPHLALLGQYFIGYSVSWAGGFIGLLYGFMCGFAAGYGASRIYNFVADFKNRGD